MRAERLRLAILGCGAVGAAFAAELADAGASLALWSRTPGRARALADRLAAEAGRRVALPATPAAALEGAGIALLAVPEEAIG
ncbi:MAG: NAD(P)-binding domain-containing protein, partial [Planctomycetota bacterium]